MKHFLILSAMFSICCFSAKALSPHPPIPGELIITEIMYNPGGGVFDSDGEWFEIYNTTDSPLELQGCRFEDSSGTGITLQPSTVIPARGVFVVGRNADTNLNGGIQLDLICGSSLNNSGDSISILHGGDLIDTVDYNGFDASLGDSPGHSYELRNGYLNDICNDDPEFWFTAIEAYETDNYGTPGRVDGEPAPPSMVEVNISCDSHGSVFPSYCSIPIGGALEITFSADPWYEVSLITVNGSSCQLPDTSIFTISNVYTYTDIFMEFSPLLATNATPYWWLAQYGWTNAFDAAALSDSDGDKLFTWQEYVAGTCPTNTNTDGDQYSDFVEVSSGLNPLTDDSAIYGAILANSELFNLYPSNAFFQVSPQNLIMGVSNGQAHMSLQIQKSENLTLWTNVGSTVEWSIPVDADKCFYRIWIAP